MSTADERERIARKLEYVRRGHAPGPIMFRITDHAAGIILAALRAPTERDPQAGYDLGYAAGRIVGRQDALDEMRGATSTNVIYPPTEREQDVGEQCAGCDDASCPSPWRDRTCVRHSTAPVPESEREGAE